MVENFGVKAKEAAKGAMWDSTSFLCEKIGAMATVLGSKAVDLGEKVGDLLLEDYVSQELGM